MPPLEIESLTVDRQRIGPDDKTTIHWRTSGAARVELIPFGEVSLSGSQRLSPKKTTRYELVATDAAGANLSRSVTVDVVRPPRIDFFKADKELVKPGDWVGLFWGTTDAETVAISTLGSVEKDGERRTRVEQSQSLILTATNEFGESVSQTLTLKTACLPRIDEFKADSTIISQGKFTYLRWKTACVDQVAISPLSKKENPDGSKKVSPDKTTTYLLTARGFENQVIRAKVTISVKPAPIQQLSVILAGGGKYFEDKRFFSAVTYAVPLQNLAVKHFGKANAYFELIGRKSLLPASKYTPSDDRARMMMKEAGYGNSISGYFYYTKDASPMVKDVLSYLARIGIKVKGEVANPTDAGRKALRSARSGRLTFLLELRK